MPPSATPSTTLPASRPHELCVARETTSGSGGSCFRAARCSSKSIAFWIWGSPKWWAKTNATSPARAPAIIPLTRRERAIRADPLVAGEAEEVARVVHELVNRVAADERQGPLFGADE